MSTVADAASAPYTGTQRGAIFCSALLGYAMDGYNLLMLSFLLVPLTKALHVSLAAMGFVFSLQLIASMLGGPLFGWIADAYGRKLSLVLAIVLYSLGALFSAFAGGFVALAAARTVTGLGLGGEWGVGMALFNETWPARRRALGGGVIQSAFLMGILGASFVAHWAQAVYPADVAWRVALGTGALPIVLALAIRFVMPESNLWKGYDAMRRAGRLPDDKAREKGSVTEIFRGAALKYTILGLFIVGCFMYSFYGMTALMPSLLAKQFHAGAEVALITELVTAISIPFYWIVGWIGDSVGRKVAFIAPAVLTVIGTLLFAVTAGLNPQPYTGDIWIWGVFWGYLLFYIGTANFAVFGVWFSEIYPVELRSTGVSTTYMIGRGVSGIAPTVVPLIAAATGSSLAIGMSTGAIAAVVMMLLPLALRETRGKQLQVIERFQ